VGTVGVWEGEGRDLEVRVKNMLGDKSDDQREDVTEQTAGLGLCDLDRGQS
jgi:hypothetical protein